MDKGKFKSVVLNTGYDRDALLEMLEVRGFSNEVKIIKRFYHKED
jgi:hypothetical protein